MYILINKKVTTKKYQGRPSKEDGHTFDLAFQPKEKERERERDRHGVTERERE